MPLEPRVLTHYDSRQESKMEPYDLLPNMPGGRPLTIEDQPSTVISEGVKSDIAGSTIDRNMTLSKMIDWSLVLELDPPDSAPLEKIYGTTPSNARTVKQALICVKYEPISLNIELKKERTVRDPRVQQAIWAISFPQEADDYGLGYRIFNTIEGSFWHCYIFSTGYNGLLCFLNTHLNSTTATN